MPVNMDPKKRLKKPAPQEARPKAQQETSHGSQAETRAKPTSKQPPPKPDKLEEMTERDRELALADAEWKNLWDATEVIDMDKW